MPNEVKNTINIDGKEYNFDDFEPEVQSAIQHVSKVQADLLELEFKAQQLNVLRDHFNNIIFESLNKGEDNS